MPLRCTIRTVERVEPDANGYARCCIIHRRMEAQLIAQVADKAWHGISTTPVNADANSSDDEDDNAGAANNDEVANATLACTARTRDDATPTQTTHVVPHQEHGAAQMLLEASYTEEALESCLSVSALISDTQHVPKEEVVRLTTKGAASKSKEHARFFGRTAICYTIFNSDAKKGMLFFNQRSGVFQQYHCIIVDTGSMVLVINRRHVQALGLSVRTGTTIVDTSLGSAGTQTHQSWGSGELMIVASPGTSHEIVVLDVPGISPDADVKFDVLLSVQVLHAMSAGILPAVPGRGAALVYHPHNGSGDFTTNAYLPLRTLKPSNEVDDSYFSAHTCADREVSNTDIHVVQQPRRPHTRPLYVVALLCVLLASFLTSTSGALLDHQQYSKTGGTHHATPMAMAMICLCSIAALCSLLAAQSWTKRINPERADTTANNAPPASWDAWASYSSQDAWRQIINPQRANAATNSTPPTAGAVGQPVAAEEDTYTVSRQHDRLIFGETLNDAPGDSQPQQEPASINPSTVPQSVHDVFHTLANRSTYIDDPPTLLPPPARTRPTPPPSATPNRGYCRFCTVKIGSTHHRFGSHQCAVSGTKIDMVANCCRPAAHLPQTIQRQVTTLMLINTIKVAQGFMPMTWDLFISQRQRMVHTPRFRINHTTPSHVPTAARAHIHNDARANTGIPVAQSASHRHQARRHGRSPPLPTWSLAVLCLACIACPSAAQGATNYRDTNNPVETIGSTITPLIETAVTLNPTLIAAIAMAATLTAILIAIIFTYRSSPHGTRGPKYQQFDIRVRYRSGIGRL
ncbi:hypothetical protein CYMTET_5997 [Cymbomonas tetramitiformis]|uniref:Uncharacterized protein n=1 Tax=Cymbomonas tetramitiformis TaxID=36881 RepID=A0AAE0LIJ4_9CHLO|nr:hypothetical protein CYMTET_5997 [Cymbomonas tetramitiformis]